MGFGYGVKKCLVVAVINKGRLSRRAAVHDMIERSSNCIRNGRDMAQIFIRQLNLTSLPHVPGSNMSPGYRRERLWTDPVTGY